MRIEIEHHNDQFNVALYAQGEEPFITIKGCRLVNGSKGPFVSWPSRKMDNGKYWNHVYASPAFGDAVVSAYNKSKADAPPARRAQPTRPARDDSEPPF